MRNSSYSRLGAGIALAALAGAALSACSTGGGDASGDEGITIMAPYLQPQPPAADSPIEKQLEKLTDTKITINWVPNSDYGDKTNIVMVGDDQPDVMVVQGKTPSFVRNAEAGAFWDLTDRLKDYPNLTTTSPEVQQNASVEGTVYGIYRARDQMRSAVILRKDWLENLGLDLPKTTDDLYEVAKAFTEQDPDGDGKDDTYGLIVPQWPGVINTSSPYDVIATWFGAGNTWTERDGELVPNFTTEEWLEANEYIKKFVDEGLINPDFATMDSATWNEPFLNGEGGIIVDVHSRAAQLNSLFKEQDPDGYQKYVTFTGNLIGPDGEMYAQPTDGYSGFLSIPRSSVQSEERLADVLEFLDKLNSKEAQILLNNGIEGENFTVENGKAVAIEDLDAEAATLAEDVKSFAQLGMNVAGEKYYEAAQSGEYEQETYDRRRAIEQSDLEHAVYNPAASLLSETASSKGAELDNIVTDARIQYFAGQLDLAGLEAAVDRWMSSGGNAVIDEINASYEK